MSNLYTAIFARGLAGVFGNTPGVYSTRSGRTIRTDKAMYDDTRDYLGLRQLQDATTYASFASAQDVYCRKEKETGITAYNLAIADWFMGPKVLEINIDQWTGKAGETIRVKARDNVIVARVTVVIRDRQGSVLEMGEARQSGPSSAWWNYTTQSIIATMPFPTLKATAEDLPGNTDSFVIY